MDVEEVNQMDLDEEESEGESSSDESEEGEVYLPGKPLEQNEELVCNDEAYVMLHQASTGAPCLSFDIIPDDLGEHREEFPLTGYIVAGTQSATAHVNNVIVMKMSNLHRTSKEKTSNDEEEEEDSDEEEEEIPADKLPQMNCALIRHQGCVNRIRCSRHGNRLLAATWSELGHVNVWNLNQQLTLVNDPASLAAYEKSGEGNRQKPLFTFRGHQSEGFAMDWSRSVAGQLVTGDCRRDIHVWQPDEASWRVDQRPLVGHTASVEDLQWSPNERSVLASCSVDRSVRIWDTRAAPAKACMLTCDGAHDSDVNVISWNRNEPLIVSGGDDGVLHVWDLRSFASKTPIATFKHHTNYISTVEWHPEDSSVLASGGADDQIALWDLSVERDEAEAAEELKDLPPQLLFIHQGQTDVKELHWHPQLPGVILSTANSGFNIFRTISV